MSAHLHVQSMKEKLFPPRVECKRKR